MRAKATRTDTIRSFSFPPVAREDARVLILGSLPGQASLEAQQYYAQPRNAFWPLMGALFGAGPEHAYADRLEKLRDVKVALWDVCESAKRPGSLDQKIDIASVTPNDFAALFVRCPQIGVIGFNGATAERFYRLLVRPTLAAPHADIASARLPSTSAAHAGRSFDEKLALWRKALGR